MHIYLSIYLYVICKIDMYIYRGMPGLRFVQAFCVSALKTTNGEAEETVADGFKSC